MHETVAHRIRLLIRERWGNNQQRLAAEAGCSRFVITRTVRGHQLPPFKLLAALAQDPRVSARWLLTGAGSPIPDSIVGELRTLLPVTKSLVESLDADSSALAETYPAAESFLRPTRYWFRVEDPQDAACRTISGLKQGDLVLVDLDADGLPEHERDAYPCVKTTDSSQSDGLVIYPPTRPKQRPRHSRGRRVKLDYAESEIASPEPAHQTQRRTTGREESKSELKGVCLKIFRYVAAARSEHHRQGAPVTTPGKRVQVLLEQCWSGNQYLLAEQSKCSQSVVSRVVNNRQAPSFKLLSALVKDPKVNSRWLLTGVGNPFIDGKSKSDNVLLYETDSLVQSLAQDWKRITGAYPVAESLYSNSRYWLRFSDSVSCRDEQLDLIAGDRVLIDTDTTAYPDDELLASPCVMLPYDPASSEPFICRPHDWIKAKSRPKKLSKDNLKNRITGICLYCCRELDHVAYACDS